jgi:hypothetical protein
MDLPPAAGSGSDLRLGGGSPDNLEDNARLIEALEVSFVDVSEQQRSIEARLTRRHDHRNDGAGRLKVSLCLSEGPVRGEAIARTNYNIHHPLPPQRHTAAMILAWSPPWLKLASRQTGGKAAG